MWFVSRSVTAIMTTPSDLSVVNQTHILKEDSKDITHGPYLIASISAVVMVRKKKIETNRFANGHSFDFFRY